MFRLDDIQNAAGIRALDRNTARILAASDTHGIIISRDRKHRGNISIFLVGWGGHSEPRPTIKAHNSFSPTQVRQIAIALIEAANEIPPTPPRGRA